MEDKDILFEEERKDMINVLGEAIQIIKKNDSLKLGGLSDHIIHCAAIFQNNEVILLAVVIHALAKVLERMLYLDPKVTEILEEAKDYLEKENLDKYNKKIRDLLEHISKQDKKLGKYMEHVINEAKIKKGTNLYEHGISLGQSAEILGLTRWELMQYVGKTKIHDKVKEKMKLKERLDHVRALFV